MLELFPETKLGHGPATESGFFYDFYRPTPFTPEDLEKIEKKMQELVQQNLPYAREFLPREQGLAEFKKDGDFMKCHFIEQFTKPDEKISIYRTGKFTDFCRGPHIPSTGKIKAFKLFNIAGAYWLGDEKNPQLQRIYGTSFYSKKDLDAYLHQVEEAKKRDHRVLGKQLDLFSIQELAGPGLIFWHPKGGIIRKEMEDWMREQYLKRGYSLVYTPHVARRQLFFTSGHEGYYSQTVARADRAQLELEERLRAVCFMPNRALVTTESFEQPRVVLVTSRIYLDPIGIREPLILRHRGARGAAAGGVARPRRAARVLGSAGAARAVPAQPAADGDGDDGRLRVAAAASCGSPAHGQRRARGLSLLRRSLAGAHRPRRAGGGRRRPSRVAAADRGHARRCGTAAS